MATILFADANESALRTMMRTQELGHRTFIIRNASMQVYQMTDWIQSTIDRAVRDLCLPVTSDADQLTEAIEEIQRNETIDAVIAQLEPAIEATAIACERLSIPFTCAEGVLRARNKARARDLLERAGLLSARHAVALDVDQALAAAENFGYPVIAKPTSGMDSMLAFRANSPAELRKAAGTILEGPSQVVAQIREQMSRGILIEEHLTGPLVSAEIALLDGVCYPLIMCGRSRAQANECIEMGAALPANTSKADTQCCYDYAFYVCQALGLDFGVFHVELILTPHGPILVELNPRPMGGIMTTMYAQLTGHEFSDYILDVYLRRPPADIASVDSRTITARKLLPMRESTLADVIDLDWVRTLDPPILAFHNYGVTPGAPVRQEQLLARYVVLTESWTSAMEFADGLLEPFERSIGVPLHRSIPPD